jgi:LmbE family N-acetylglucosaminyl deacetylase
MLKLGLAFSELGSDQFKTGLSVLALGAHPDDIEIGCGGSILRLLKAYPDSSVRWVVLSGEADRADEARLCAKKFLEKAHASEVTLAQFRDGFFPYIGREVKQFFEELKGELSPDLIFTHYRADLHQDHRLISELTWNTFRDHLIFEYEIPKYDGDLGTPNVFVPLSEQECGTKVQLILDGFPSQLGRRWFSRDVFFFLLRQRGMESNSPSGYSEAFYCRKAVLA